MIAARPIDVAAARELVASDRWADKIEHDPSGCWLWTGGKTAGGYGLTHLAGRSFPAHRVALVAALGRDLDPGMQAGHRCHDTALAAGECTPGPCEHRRCVNPAPAHLSEQSNRENSLAGGTLAARNAGTTHCPNGHELAGDNLSPGHLAQGARVCRRCQLAKQAGDNAILRRARIALGLTHREYLDAYGASADRALVLLAALEVRALMARMYPTAPGQLTLNLTEKESA